MAAFTITGWINRTHYIGSHCRLTFEDGEISGTLALIELVRESCSNLKSATEVEAAARLFLDEPKVVYGLQPV